MSKAKNENLTLLDVARKYGVAYADRNEQIFLELMLEEGFTLHGAIKSAYQDGFHAGLKLKLTGE